MQLRQDEEDIDKQGDVSGIADERGGGEGGRDDAGAEGSIFGGG